MKYLDLNIQMDGTGRPGTGACLRYQFLGDDRLMVYESGPAEAAHEMVAKLRAKYNTNAIDYLVCSHPSEARAPGLAAILREMQVGELWMHRPWAHSTVLAQHLRDHSDSGPGMRLKLQLRAAHRLETIALERGTRVREPFCGDHIGAFDVLMPHRDWYVDGLLANFDQSNGKGGASQLILTTMYERPWLTRTGARTHALRRRHPGGGDPEAPPQRLKADMELCYSSGCLLIAASF